MVLVLSPTASEKEKHIKSDCETLPLGLLLQVVCVSFYLLLATLVDSLIGLTVCLIVISSVLLFAILNTRRALVGSRRLREQGVTVRAKTDGVAYMQHVRLERLIKSAGLDEERRNELLMQLFEFTKQAAETERGLSWRNQKGKDKIWLGYCRFAADLPIA